MTNRILLVVTMAFTLAPAPSWAEDPCLSLIPPDGAFRTVAIDKSVKTFRSSKEWFCSEEFLHRSESGQLGLEAMVPVEGIPVGAAFDQSNASHMEARSKFCSSSEAVFNEQQNALLHIREGDKDLLGAFLACEDERAKEFLSVMTTADEETFEIAVSTVNYPNAEPLIVDTRALMGAKPVATDDLVVGAPIPIQGGKAPLKGVFKFDDGARTAMIQVRTSIGSKTVKVARCATGDAGSWKLQIEETTIDKQPGSPVTFQVQIPQGSCHSHCQPGEGDPFTVGYDIPANEEWSGASFACTPWLPECNLIPSRIDIAGKKLYLWYMARTIAVTATLTANRTLLVPVTTKVEGGNGKLVYGKDFSVTIPTGRNGILTLSSEQGEVALAEDQLMSKKLPRGIVMPMDPQLTGDSTIFTLRPELASCTAAR